MIDVKFDTDLAQSFILMFGDEFVESVLNDLAEGARAKWISLAQRTLKSSKADYPAG